MSEVTGVIQKIDSRKVANGTKTAYDVYVAGQKYGAGLFAPKVKEGDYVTFTANKGQYGWDIERGTLKVSANKPSPAETKAAVSKAVGSFDARQDAISRQAASNTAISWIEVLLSAGAITIPTTKKGQAQAILDTIRVEYEKKFYEANTGNEWKDISPNPSTEDGADADSESESPEDSPWE